MKKSLLLDCDPGIDDALAIALLLTAEKFEPLAVSTCAGNQTQDTTFRNARNLLALFGRADIPVFRGEEKPLQGTLFTAADVHGDNGLGGVELPASPAFKHTENAADALTAILKETTEPLTLLATGPLTNLACLLQQYPLCKRKIERIILMGGARNGGNVTPCAEFNIYVDPQAAQIVFQSGIPIIMFGLDVTNCTVLLPEEIAEIGRIQNNSAPLLYRMLCGKEDVAASSLDMDTALLGGSQVHDALTAAYLLRPELFTFYPAQVEVETKGVFTSGCTVVQLCGEGESGNTQIALQADREGFAALVLEQLQRLP